MRKKKKRQQGWLQQQRKKRRVRPKKAAQKEAEQQRKQVLCPRQAVSFVFCFSLIHCSLSRSSVPVRSHLVTNDSIVSLMQCLGCPATALSSCILCTLHAEKEPDEQRKRDKVATRLAAAAEEEEARKAKEAAEKAAGLLSFPPVISFQTS